MLFVISQKEHICQTVMLVIYSVTQLLVETSVCFKDQKFSSPTVKIEYYLQEKFRKT